jgi:hypothetical protein
MDLGGFAQCGNPRLRCHRLTIYQLTLSAPAHIQMCLSRKVQTVRGVLAGKTPRLAQQRFFTASRSSDL